MFYALAFSSFFLTFVILYLVHLNTALNGTPEDALKLSPNRWTEDEIKETYRRICEQPINSSAHLPPKLGRRYIVTGSSGEFEFLQLWPLYLKLIIQRTGWWYYRPAIACSRRVTREYSHVGF